MVKKTGKWDGVKLDKKPIDPELIATEVEQKSIDAESIDEEEMIEVDVCNMSYTTFLLFYAYLRARKMGHSRQGGWIYNDMKILQRGTDYIFEYQGVKYPINKETVFDMSEIILKYV